MWVSRRTHLAEAADRLRRHGRLLVLDAVDLAVRRDLDGVRAAQDARRVPLSQPHDELEAGRILAELLGPVRHQPREAVRVILQPRRKEDDLAEADDRIDLRARCTEALRCVYSGTRGSCRRAP